MGFPSSISGELQEGRGERRTCTVTSGPIKCGTEFGTGGEEHESFAQAFDKQVGWKQCLMWQKVQSLCEGTRSHFFRCTLRHSLGIVEMRFSHLWLTQLESITEKSRSKNKTYCYFMNEVLVEKGEYGIISPYDSNL
jgi:hypothetical protein